MRNLKQLAFTCTAVLAAVAFFGSDARAEILGGIDWADDAVAYSSRIQNYAGTLMTDATKWWATGAPDGDADGDGYMGTAGDLDNVAGWRTTNEDQFITLYWENGFSDLPGDDLAIVWYGGNKAAANVSVSADGLVFTPLGALAGSTANTGLWIDSYFDLSGIFEGTGHYLKLERTVVGPNSGLFVDAAGAATVPEPGTFAILAAGTIGFYGFRRRRTSVDNRMDSINSTKAFSLIESGKTPYSWRK